MDLEKAYEPAPQKPYEPTPQEQARLKAFLANRKESPPSPRIKILDAERTPKLSPDHPDIAIGQLLLMQSLGTEDFDFYDGIIRQLVNAGTQGRTPDESGLNFLLSVVKGLRPRDQVETMIAAQMAAVHVATMTFARRLAHVENIPQQDSAERAFNKLARTFAAQVEALKRYRANGEQRVTVKHVTVNEGGQAIVGNVNHGASPPRGEGVPKKSEDQPHAKQIAHAPEPQMRSPDEIGEEVPISRRSGKT